MDIKKRTLFSYLLISGLVLISALYLVFFAYKDEPNRLFEVTPLNKVIEVAFSEPVKGDVFRYEKTATISSIFEFNQEILIKRDSLWKIYQVLRILSINQLEPKEGVNIVELQFEYKSKRYKSFSYGKLPYSCGVNNFGVLLIPGSGNNQSSILLDENKQHYQSGIIDALEPFNANTFVLIKPNEDYLALHNGKGAKLSKDFIVGWQLNNGGSYSLSYVVQSLAFSKWLNNCFEISVVAGISQGGRASLLNAIIASPDIAIVASGHSILFRDVEWVRLGGLLGLSELSELANEEFLRFKLGNKTKYFFSWGIKETGPYGLDASMSLTADAISDLSNVHTVIHDGGHEYPVNEIRNFLQENAGNF